MQPDAAFSALSIISNNAVSGDCRSGQPPGVVVVVVVIVIGNVYDLLSGIRPAF